MALGAYGVLPMSVPPALCIPVETHRGRRTASHLHFRSCSDRAGTQLCQVCLLLPILAYGCSFLRSPLGLSQTLAGVWSERASNPPGEHFRQIPRICVCCLVRSHSSGRFHMCTDRGDHWHACVLACTHAHSLTHIAEHVRMHTRLCAKASSLVIAGPRLLLCPRRLQAQR